MAGMRSVIEALPNGLLSLDVESLVLDDNEIANNVFNELRPQTATLYVVEQNTNGFYKDRYLIFVSVKLILVPHLGYR